jgi:patatin-like phospholipase/acyl hydrolase
MSEGFCAPSKKLYRALAIDGGGVFGVIPATQLKDKDVLNDFDIYGGTSIGAACAAWYAMGLAPADLPVSMSKALPKIFSRSIWDKLKIWGPKWPKTELEDWCKSTFTTKLKHLNKHIFIVSMDYSRRRPKVFDSRSPKDGETYLWEAVLASVSAPTYFAPQGDLVDGGIFANTPSVVTAAGVAASYNVEMGDIAILSVGTGNFNKDPLDMKRASYWSILGWATTLIPVMMEGGTETGMTYIANQLPLAVYYRSNLVALDKSWNMDDPSVIPSCIGRAEDNIDPFNQCYKNFKDDCNRWVPTP